MTEALKTSILKAESLPTPQSLTRSPSERATVFPHNIDSALSIDPIGKAVDHVLTTETAIQFKQTSEFQQVIFAAETSEDDLEPERPFYDRIKDSVRMAVQPVTDRKLAKPLAGLLALEMAAAACGPAAVTPEPTPNQTAHQTPSAEVSPSATPTVAPTASPTLEISPSPEIKSWVDLIPPDPYSNINKVPLAKDVNGLTSESSVIMSPDVNPPWYSLGIQASTIVAVEPDVKNDIVWVAIAMAEPGTKITKSNCKSINVNGVANVNMCSYSGAPLWLEVDKKTNIGGAVTGKGPEALAPFLQVGNQIKSGFGLAYISDIYSTKSQIDMNNVSWNRLINSVGKSFDRSYRGFGFYVPNLSVYLSQS